MRFSLVAAVLLPVLSAAADNILIAVGANNQLAFSPTNVTANVGDTITFQFQNKNHSVTQSTFANPCEIQTTPAEGVNSGFQFVAPGSTELPEWSFTVNNASAPLWFFCAQTNPVDHCQMGMVFAVNADPDGQKNFAVYQATAMSGGGAPPAGGAPPVASDTASFGDTATSDAASLGSDATSFFGDATSAVASLGSEATAAVASVGSEATAAGASLGSDATAAAGSLFGGSSPSPTSSANNSSSSGQTGAGLRLERSASLPVLAAIGLAGVLLL